MEQWRDHPTYNLKVSNTGKIRGATGKDRKYRLDCYGYWRFNISYKGKHLTVMVHKIVAETWLGPSKGLTVNHIDGNKLNNTVTNLEYVTAEVNTSKAFAAGLVGTCHPVMGFYSKREASRQTGLARSEL